MGTTITITLDETLSEEEKAEIQYTVSDALYEFKGHRTPAREYVESRYPVGDFHTEEWQQKKVAQVERRLQVARVLWDAALRNLKVE